MSLPSGYKRLEYIQSTGTQYINTEFKPNNNTRVVLDFELTAAYSSIVGIFGARDENSGTAANQFVFWNNGVSTFRTDYFRTQRTITVSTLLARYQVDKNKNVTTIGSISVTNTVNTGQCINNLCLFCTNTAGTVNYFSKIKLYSCQIYDNKIIVRDFIPCQKSDGIIGLWDDVNSVFYGNAGTGMFTAGPVIAIAVDESEIRKLKYIQSSQTQYIDTGFTPNQDTRVDLKISTSNSGSRTMLGSDVSWRGNGFAIGVGFSHYGTETSNNSGMNDGSVHEISLNKNVLYIDGIAAKTYSAQTFSVGYPMALFANNRSGSIDEKTAMNLYYCKIYDNETLVRDFVPCIKDDGTVGLYDKLNGLLYINAGTGVFISGGYTLNLPVNIGGTWKDANEAFVNIGGTWKTVEAAFVNIGGTWKELG